MVGQRRAVTRTTVDLSSGGLMFAREDFDPRRAWKCRSRRSRLAQSSGFLSKKGVSWLISLTFLREGIRDLDSPFFVAHFRNQMMLLYVQSSDRNSYARSARHVVARLRTFAYCATAQLWYVHAQLNINFRYATTEVRHTLRPLVSQCSVCM